MKEFTTVEAMFSRIAERLANVPEVKSLRSGNLAGKAFGDTSLEACLVAGALYASVALCALFVAM